MTRDKPLLSDKTSEALLLAIILPLAGAHVLARDYAQPLLESATLACLVVLGALLGAIYGARRSARMKQDAITPSPDRQGRPLDWPAILGWSLAPPLKPQKAAQWLQHRVFTTTLVIVGMLIVLFVFVASNPPLGDLVVLVATLGLVSAILVSFVSMQGMSLQLYFTGWTDTGDGD